MIDLEVPSAAKAQAVARHIHGVAMRSPLVSLRQDRVPAKIYLKLDNIQPCGSFKLRGAYNAISRLPSNVKKNGLYTASAGNFAQGVAWCARDESIAVRVIVPDHAPEAKIVAIRALGAHPIRVPYEEWWRTITEQGHPNETGHYVNPVGDPDVVAGYGTIGLEIMEDMPETGRIIIPYGSGCLASAIGSVARDMRDDVEIYAVEPTTGAPFAAALENGEITRVTYQPSFIDGIGSGSVLPHIWPVIRRIAKGSLVVSPGQVEDALRYIWRATYTVAEGAGAASLAAALADPDYDGIVVCVVSGAHINRQELFRILGDDG